MEDIFTGDLAKLERTDKYCKGKNAVVPTAAGEVKANYNNFFMQGDNLTDAKEAMHKELVRALDYFDSDWRGKRIVLCNEEGPYVLGCPNEGEPLVLGYHVAVVNPDTGESLDPLWNRQTT